MAGIGMARLLTARVPERSAVPFAAWLVLGSMLPDVDMYPTAVAFLAKWPDLINVIHRSLTHSLVLLVLLLVAGAFARKPAWRFGLWGLGIGISTHILLDTLFWFTQIDLFWPFSHLPSDAPLLPVVNLWAAYHMPPLFVNIREAFEYAAFALLLYALLRISPSDPYLAKWIRFAWCYFVVTLVTAFVFLESPATQNVIVTGPYLLILLPVCWLAVWRDRGAIAVWAQGRPAVRLPADKAV